MHLNVKLSVLDVFILTFHVFCYMDQQARGRSQNFWTLNLWGDYEILLAQQMDTWILPTWPYYLFCTSISHYFNQGEM